MTDANTRQVGGAHYASTYQHWDWIINVALPYLPAQVTKYITRWRKKNGLQDIEKAKHFLDKYIEAEEARALSIWNTTDKFLSENHVEIIEARIIRHLVQYSIGAPHHLKLASDALDQMIKYEKEKTKQDVTPASSK